MLSVLYAASPFKVLETRNTPNSTRASVLNKVLGLSSLSGQPPNFLVSSLYISFCQYQSSEELRIDCRFHNHSRLCGDCRVIQDVARDLTVSPTCRFCQWKNVESTWSATAVFITPIMWPLGTDSFYRTEPNLVYNDSLSTRAICHNILLHNDQLVLQRRDIGQAAHERAQFAL